jgi:hypothetical protein
MKFSGKQLMINKANARMITVIIIASIVVVFSMVASRALLSQRSYQARVITQKEKAVKQLKTNVDAVQKLAGAYTTFVNQPVNAIGGSLNGVGNRDGDNAKIILDALPSQYDFPALATSLEKVLTSPTNKIEAITGIDDELNQQAANSSPNPLPVNMPFEIKVDSTYVSIQGLITTLQQSIRPFQVLTMQLSGADAALKLDMTARTYYQPSKSLTIKTTVIK